MRHSTGALLLGFSFQSIFLGSHGGVAIELLLNLFLRRQVVVGRAAANQRRAADKRDQQQ